ncbi:MAG: hypothetical protein IJP54_02265 [Synergistaceae bacterium]|nr:hypothetical protein [Synergistaceae bacterium]
MSVEFANVTDITIPQGEVTKIEETSTGRVLWEKKSTEQTYTFTVRVSNDNGYDERVVVLTVK